MIKTIVKTVVLVIICAIANGIDNAISPIIANELAMQQMSNTIDSSVWIQLYTTLNNNKFWLMIVVTIITYAREIESLFLKAKETKSNEN